MTNPVSNSSERDVQVSQERKKVSWGDIKFVSFEPTCLIPEGFPEHVEELARQLLTCRVDLKDALTNSYDSRKRESVIRNLRHIINASSKETDPLSKKINSISHIFLARTFAGVSSSNYLDEREAIERDSQMRELYLKWKDLLTSSSIFE